MTQTEANASPKDAALKMALESLEECRRDPRLKYEHPTYEKTITAIKEALAQPEPSPEWMTEEEQTAYTFGWFKALEQQRLAQPEQEPVAFIVKQYVGDGRPSIKGNGFDGLEIGYIREEADEFIAWVNNHITTPPTQCNCSQRQCNVKPLTDEQIDAIADKFTVHTGEMWEPELCIEFNDSCKSVHSFARAIEAAHGIKE